MKYKRGVVGALVLLLVLSLVAISGVAIMAQQRNVTRQLNTVRSSGGISGSSVPNPGASLAKGPCPEWGIGDANDDGALKADDATAILKYVAGTSKVLNIYKADVNADKKITAVDAQLIDQFIAGKMAWFTACPVR